MSVPAKPNFLARWARSLAGVAGANIATPSSGQQDTGWTAGQQGISSYENWKSQNYSDWLAQLAIALPSSAGYFQGFESATFPPADGGGIAWTAPSVRYGSDLAYQRYGTGAIAGSWSANRNSSQAASQNSSLGFDAFLMASSRISFVFDLLCNASYGDHLDFYVDGFLTGSWSCVTNTTRASGRFMSAVLREGYHTFDWRFVRGVSGSVASEKALVDQVNIIPELAWLDWTNRFRFEDDFFGNSFNSNLWAASNSGNAGSVAVNNGTTGMTPSGGVIITSAAVAANDWEALSLAANNNNMAWGGGVGGDMSALFRVGLPSTAAMFFECGLWDGTTTNTVCWVYDSTVGTDWRFKCQGVTYPTGAVANSGVLVEFGIHSAGVPSAIANTFLGTLGGASIASGAGSFPGNSAGGPLANMVPYIRVGSRTAAAAKVAIVDFVRVMGQRNAGQVI